MKYCAAAQGTPGSILRAGDRWAPLPTVCHPTVPWGHSCHPSHHSQDFFICFSHQIFCGSLRKGWAEPRAGGGCRAGTVQAHCAHKVWGVMISANWQDSFLELCLLTYDSHHNIRFSKMSVYRWSGREGGCRDKTVYWENNKRKINLYDRWVSEIYSVIRKHKEIHVLPGRVSRQCYSIDGNTIVPAGSVCLFLSKSSNSFCWSG